MPYCGVKGSFFMKQTPRRSFVSCRLLEGSREKHYTSCKPLGISQILRQSVCVWGVGEIKPPARAYRRSERRETTVGLKWASWTEVWFVTGSATDLTFLSFGYLRCFLCLNFPGSLHVSAGKPYECSLLYILLSRRYLGCFRRAK